MVSVRFPRTLRTIPFLIAVCLLGLPVYAKYSGGTGEANDPYQIATAADLIALGETPEDYSKHFILTADIDLDPNLPGRKVFDKAVIAPDTDETKDWFQGTPFTGIFDGSMHTVSHLTVTGTDCLGLFGQLGSWDALACQVKNLGVVDIYVTGSGNYVGGLAGENHGTVTQCHSTGLVSSTGQFSHNTGGLVGQNGGTLTQCCSSAAVSGQSYIGGLVGWNLGAVTQSYSAGSVSGDWRIGGVVGENYRGFVTNCYGTGSVSGGSGVGGLVGGNSVGRVKLCYSTGAVSGTGQDVGGLVGGNYAGEYGGVGSIDVSFWDTQTSGQATSAGGTGKTIAEMQRAKTFLDSGWDFVGETANGTEDIWKIAEGLGYPRLSWQRYSGGTGEPNDPYQIATAEDLMALGNEPNDYDKHFILTTDIDLDPNLPGRKVFDRAVIAPDADPKKDDFQGSAFTGVFDGNGYRISHLTIEGGSYLGLFGWLEGGEVKRLGVADVNITGSGVYVAGLVGSNSPYYSRKGGTVTQCYSSGAVTGGWYVGALVGYQWLGQMTQCYSDGTVSGTEGVGGLVGANQAWFAERGIVSDCHSTSDVKGTGRFAGGLAGYNSGDVTECYSTGRVDGNDYAGGLVGSNDSDFDGDAVYRSTVTRCYSTSVVRGKSDVGGLVGYNVGTITDGYATGGVVGQTHVGGLLGLNGYEEPQWGEGPIHGGMFRGTCVWGVVACAYSVGAVSGTSFVGGLVGTCSDKGEVSACFWDTQTSGQGTSDGGTGKTTAEMQTAKTFLDSGWDFVGEKANGTEDIWWINEGKDYPRLWWEEAGQ